jgi:hypothetical protein
MRNNLNKSLFTFVMLLISVYSMAQATPKAQPAPKEELSVKLTSPDKPFRLSIGLIEGNIKILTHTGKEILVEAELQPEKKKPESNTNQNQGSNTNININQHTNTPGLRQTKENSTINGKYVTVTETDNTVRIGQVDPYARVNVIIKVPTNMVKVKLTIALSGEVSVKDISGETEVNNPNGSIALTNISGSAVATTINGNITVTFASVTENMPMAFSTLIGKIDVTFPRSLKANMNVQSNAGTLFSDYHIVFDGTPKVDTVKAPTLYRASIAGKLSGKINGGGAEMLMKNMNGNIYIRRAKQPGIPAQ